jgi:hypothetical protein
MLATNIETEVRKILEKKGKKGWMRTHDCAKEYANNNGSRETKFYRFTKKVEKGKAPGFQVLLFPKNISFIGLDSADPKIIESLLERDKKARRSIKSGFGFREWWKDRSERKSREEERQKRELLARFYAHAEFAAKKWPEFESLKEYADILKKHRRELGLE